MTPPFAIDSSAAYRAVSSRDRRFDGMFYVAVRTTGIYCRPSCPARTPARQNVSFHASTASAQSAGFRACKRCLPDATPGSPDWDIAADVAGRAMRLISDGVVDRDGVPGLARQLGYTPRHLTRILTAHLGAGPLALARARRAQTARVLVESTDLTLSEVAHAAGFSSIRQFNETMREVYATTPSALRGRRSRAEFTADATTGTVTMRLAVRTPFHGSALRDFLALHAVEGVEVCRGDRFARTLDLPHGPGSVELTLVDHLDGGSMAMVPATFRLNDLRDLGAGVERTRRMLDADCDPIAVADALGEDPLLRPMLDRWPGLRVPGLPDGPELGVRAVLGQQVSLAAARTAAARLVAEYGRPYAAGLPGLTHLFPRAERLAELDADRLPMPRTRASALVSLSRAVADGHVDLDRGADRDDVRRRLLALPGIGPWTADVIALRALGHPDVFLPSDLAIKRVLADLEVDAGEASARIDRWRPWRSYALLYLWQHYLSDRSDPVAATKES